MLAVC